MASTSLRAELECSICLNVYTDPVTLRCGHNFCRLCIGRLLDSQESSGIYSCPECRKRFGERPALHKNITLCNIANNFRSTHPDQERPDVFCTYCIHSTVSAVKSCMHCDAFLCDDHLKVHSKSPEHVLCDLTASWENRKCSVHKKILEYYCTEDSACICVYCAAGEHREHQVKTLDEASEMRKKKLINVLQELVEKTEETEKRVQRLQENQNQLQEKATQETNRAAVLLRDVKRCVEDLEVRSLSEISKQEHLLSPLIQKLEIKKEELSRKICHIEELCNTTDPLTVLQESDAGDLCGTEEEETEDSESCEKLHNKVNMYVARISHNLRSLCNIVREVNACFYIQDPVDISLDGDTASNSLQISDDGKTVSWSGYQRRYETPERFQSPQVMSSQSFSSGQHYWEVDVGGSEGCYVGMCYPSIPRKGAQSAIGLNSESWGLQRDGHKYQIVHDNKVIRLTDPISSNKVRVYLDYGSGQISFYAVLESVRHLHSFTASFTEPLHAVLCVLKGSIKVTGGNRAL